MCRGCCCGAPEKHPRVDHEAQQEAIEDAAREAGGARVLVVDCLDECSHSNVIVVRHRGSPRPSTVWLGGVLSQRQTRALCDWIRDGGPRSAGLPPVLALAAFVPGRDAVCAVDRLAQGAT